MSRKQRRRRKRLFRHIRYLPFVAIFFALIFLLWPREQPLVSFLAGSRDVYVEQTPAPSVTMPIASTKPTKKPTPTPSPRPTPTPTPTPTPKPTPTPAPVYLTVSAVGDCTLGGDPRGVSKKAFDTVFKQQGEDFGYFFQNVRDYFEHDDITIVNLEGTLTTRTKNQDKTFCFRGDPSYVNILASSSVEACNLANNHTLDFFQDGFDDTKRALDENGISHFGYDSVSILSVKGVTVGLCGFTRWRTSEADMRSTIEMLRPQCDIVIASFHWGDEGKAATKEQMKMGRAAVDAGADLVLGHHPHIVQGIEKYNGVYIVYSLGNFCFGGNTNPNDKDTFIFQQTFIFQNKSLSDGGISVIPCKLSTLPKKNDYQPIPMSGEEGDKILARIEKLSGVFPEPAVIR